MRINVANKVFIKVAYRVVFLVAVQVEIKL